MSLSFSTAKELRSRIESLPPGPQWKAKAWETLHATKKPLTLFYRDPVECLQELLVNPLMQDSIHFTPFRLYSSAAKVMRVYTEWLSSDRAWKMQASAFTVQMACYLRDVKEQLPSGATILGTIISSDKTQISAMTGNHQAHPALISTTAIDMDFRSKASHHAFMMFALLPIAKFLEKKQRNSRSSGEPTIPCSHGFCTPASQECSSSWGHGDRSSWLPALLLYSTSLRHCRYSRVGLDCGSVRGLFQTPT